ncbi:hypothetical protein [Chryseobacterium sp. Leaf180]|jgi:hypothetical protein|uniref:hypothetical protein n=1 Tax=Chryseobacterium sp. Leaf180 TaxID=1736289 RepID=UPI000AC30BFC|nr:hypothetical protein [Chryseobacterium sp. Leaf180]
MIHPFIQQSFLFCINEADNRETAETILTAAKKLKAPNIREIKNLFNRKFRKS